MNNSLAKSSNDNELEIENINYQIDGVVEDKVSLFNDFILGTSKNKMWTIPDKELKVFILKHKLLEHECKICKRQPVWRNKPLDLVLDRINNIATDNQIENLRFVCPNCISQVKSKSTIFEKQITSKMIKCEKCNKRIKYKTFYMNKKTSINQLCSGCLQQDRLEMYINSRSNLCE
jgi:hypothetical protein